MLVYVGYRYGARFERTFSGLFEALTSMASDQAFGEAAYESLLKDGRPIMSHDDLSAAIGRRCDQMGI